MTTTEKQAHTAKLTRAERVFLDIAARFSGGTINVFSDQRVIAARLAARGLVTLGGTLLVPQATITDPGRAALAKAEGR